jgi:hypothetical protein
MPAAPFQATLQRDCYRSKPSGKSRDSAAACLKLTGQPLFKSITEKNFPGCSQNSERR